MENVINKSGKYYSCHSGVNREHKGHLIYAEFLEEKLKRVVNKKNVVLKPCYSRSDMHPVPSDKAELLYCTQLCLFNPQGRRHVDQSKSIRLKAKLLKKTNTAKINKVGTNIHTVTLPLGGQFLFHMGELIGAKYSDKEAYYWIEARNHIIQWDILKEYYKGSLTVAKGVGKFILDLFFANALDGTPM